MDAHPREFGSFQVRASFGDGRFGPVFLADDPETGRRVVVRTFTQPLTDEQRAAVVAALRDLCELPLDHPSVARPIDCGLDGDTPYFVHAFLEGIPADEYLAANGPSRLADLMPLLTPAAAAIDFSSAAGVTHGALGLRDVIVSTDAAGVSGFGLVQALQSAGVDLGGIASDPAGSASPVADIRAFGTITSALLIQEDAARIRPLVDNPPLTALEFVAALQEVLAEEAMTADGAVTEVAPSAPIVTQPELQLREAPDVVQPALFAASADLPPETHGHAGRRWVPLAVAASLVIGLVAGFAGGVVVGRREGQSAPPQKTAAPPRPTATAGQIFTDQGVARQPSPATESRDSEPVVQPPPSLPVPGSPVPNSPAPGSTVGSVTRNQPANPERRAGMNAERGTANQERGSANREQGTGNRELERSRAAAASFPPSLWVESRPTGANVYVDNQLVGRTPLLLGGIDPGGHTVRLEMTGYQQWTTRVTVAGNGRTRVAASLEQ